MSSRRESARKNNLEEVVATMKSTWKKPKASSKVEADSEKPAAELSRQGDKAESKNQRAESNKCPPNINRTRVTRSHGKSWKEMFGALWQYNEKNGDCNVPQFYKSEEGVCLGLWVSTQKRRKNLLSEEQQNQLTALGFDWLTGDIVSEPPAKRVRIYKPSIKETTTQSFVADLAETPGFIDTSNFMTSQHQRDDVATDTAKNLAATARVVPPPKKPGPGRPPKNPSSRTAVPVTKRGPRRPRKHPISTDGAVPTKKRGPGRHSKNPGISENFIVSAIGSESVLLKRRGPGRPRKTCTLKNSADALAPKKRGPGRPRKNVMVGNSAETIQPTKRGPGRPRKNPIAEVTPKKKRGPGRPRKCQIQERNAVKGGVSGKHLSLGRSSAKKLSKSSGIPFEAQPHKAWEPKAQLWRQPTNDSQRGVTLAQQLVDSTHNKQSDDGDDDDNESSVLNESPTLAQLATPPVPAGSCQICGKGDDGRQMLRFPPLHHNDSEICLHVFCGKTASFLPRVNKPEMEILNERGLRNKHGSGPRIAAALAMSRCAVSTQEGGQKTRFYLVKEFETKLTAAITINRKKLPDPSYRKSQGKTSPLIVPRGSATGEEAGDATTTKVQEDVAWENREVTKTGHPLLRSLNEFVGGLIQENHSLKEENKQLQLIVQSEERFGESGSLLNPALQRQLVDDNEKNEEWFELLQSLSATYARTQEEAEKAGVHEEQLEQWKALEQGGKDSSTPLGEHPQGFIVSSESENESDAVKGNSEQYLNHHSENSSEKEIGQGVDWFEMDLDRFISATSGMKF